MSETIEKIKTELESNKVVLFMKGSPDMPQCGFSAASVDILRGFNCEFKGVDVLSNPDIRQELPAYSNWPTFPQLFIKGNLVGGCDIIHEMRDSGELEKMLKEADAISA